MKVIAGIAVVVLIVVGAKTLASRRAAPGPRNPPPEPIDTLPPPVDAGAPGGAPG